MALSDPPPISPAREQEIADALSNIQPVDEHVKRNRYDHGGGRMFRDPPMCSRSLILDVYEEGDREFYFNAASFVRDLLSLVSSLRQEQERLREALSATTAMCRSATTWPADDTQGLRHHALEQAKIGMAALARKELTNG